MKVLTDWATGHPPCKGREMKQPEALRLADALEHDAATQKIYHRPLVDASASELRRLHEVNAELLAALKQIQNANIPGLTFTPELDAAIAKAEEVK